MVALALGKIRTDLLSYDQIFLTIRNKLKGIGILGICLNYLSTLWTRPIPVLDLEMRAFSPLLYCPVKYYLAYKLQFKSLELSS